MSWQLLAAVEGAFLELDQYSEELLQDPIPEATISDKLSFLLREEGYRTASRVNLWELAADLRQERNPVYCYRTCCTLFEKELLGYDIEKSITYRFDEVFTLFGSSTPGEGP